MANVNYIVERETFARHARDNGYTGDEQLIWYALFTICNERASRTAYVWPDGFIRVSNKEILSWLPFGEKTLIRARGDLVNPAKHQPVLVDYIKGKRNTDAPQYRMHWFSTGVDCYRISDGNMGGNIEGNMGGNAGGNLRGNMGDITVNINQQQAVIQTGEKRLYNNQAWRTDARARRAVAQNVLEAAGYKGVSPIANAQVCHFLGKGMTPEQALEGLNGIDGYPEADVGGWLQTAAGSLGLPESDEDKYFVPARLY